MSLSQAAAAVETEREKAKQERERQKNQPLTEADIHKMWGELKHSRAELGRFANKERRLRETLLRTQTKSLELATKYEAT